MLEITLTNTNAGAKAIQRALAGEDIIFTKAEIGDGTLANLDVVNFTSLINKIADFPLAAVKAEDQELVRLRTNINNKNINVNAHIREYGLYAKFGQENEFLFAYMNTGVNITSLPAITSGRYDLNRDFILYIGKSTNVNFNTNGDLVYATLKELRALDAAKEPTIAKKSGFNLEKTDECINDTNKSFTAAGAFKLKNWLVQNYTTAIQTSREFLLNLINGKLNHGGYNGSGQDLKNLVDNKVSASGYNIINGTLNVNGELKLNNSSVYTADSIIVQDVRLGAKIYKQIWNSLSSSTETPGYVTVNIQNENGDSIPDGEFRRPLQKLIKGQWITVSVE